LEVVGRSYSLDLRRRVIDRIAGGQTRRGAAEHLSVSASFAVKLVARRERTGSMEPAPQAPAGHDFLIGPVKEKPDITMPELAAELETLHGKASGFPVRFRSATGKVRPSSWPCARAG